jgi:hypothetical protein
MRVVVKRSDIIKIGSSFVSSAAPSDGIVPMVDMQVTFGVNIPRLLDMGGTSLRISVYDQEVYLDTRRFVTEMSGDSLTTSTVNESMEKDRITRVRDELCLYKDNIDATKFISNDKGKVSNRGERKNLVEYISMLDRDSGSKGTNMSPEVPKSSTTQADEKFMRNLVSRGIDPATVSTKFPVLDPSVMRRFTGLHDTDHSREETTGTRPVEVYSLVGNPAVYRKSFSRTNYYRVNHIIQMPYTKISQVSKLYFHVEALGKGNVSVDYEVVQFDTKQMVNDIDRVRANSVKILDSFKRGEVTNYFREVTPPRSKKLSYFLPFKGGNEQFIPFKKGNPLVLRSIANNNSTISTQFAGRVYLRSNPITKSVQSGTNDVPFYIVRNGDEIQFKVPSVPEKIVTVQLQRRDVFRRESYANLGSPTLVTVGDSVTLIDNTMRDSCTYEYRLSFIDNRSNSRNSSNTLLYHYVSSALSPPCSLSIVNVNKGTFTAPIGNVPTVTITVDSGTVEKGIQGTKEFLRSKGLDVSLLGDLINDSAGYNQLPIYEVLRVNIRTGDIENLGKFSDEKILDDSAVPGGKVKGVDPLSFFESYRYIIKLGLRSPSALSTNQTSRAIDPATGRSYTYNSYKFRSRRTSTDLPSSEEMSRLASKSVTDINIDRIDVGVESSVNVTFEDLQPKVFDLNLRKTFVRSNLLTWKVSGESKLVDHYQVYAEADGIKALLGCAHPYTNDGEYRYEDRQMHDRVGVVTYNVVPIRLDFTRALGDAKVSVVNESTLLDFLRE